MRQTNVSASLGLLFLSMALVASTDFTQALDAQAPAAGTTVAVRMLDAVNSGSDPARKQYRASVTKEVTAANGITIAQGSAAIVTLTNSGAGYTTQLVSVTVTVNGQPVAVTSGSASVLLPSGTMLTFALNQPPTVGESASTIRGSTAQHTLFATPSCGRLTYQLREAFVKRS